MPQPPVHQLLLTLATMRWKIISLVLLCALNAGARVIPAQAHMGDTTLRVITIPADITTIGELAYAGCSNLERIEFAPGSRLKEIGRSAFAGCRALKEIVLPDGVKKLSPHAFAYCFSLETAILPQGLESVGNNAFSECRSLREAVLPNSVTLLESYAFSECVSLRRAVLPANPSLLGELMFSGCRSLEEIVELSPAPPEFECKSFIFEPDEEALYRQCTLKVAPGKEESYRKAHGWQMFRKIKSGD